MARLESYHPDFRLLPAILDRKAAENPNGIYACLPKSDSLDDGFRDFTNLELVQAVDAFALWLETTLGRSDRFETLAYVGVSDLRYVVFFYGCVKTGYKTLVFSPRNTAAQNAALLQQTECSHVFFSEKYQGLADGLAQLPELKGLRTSAFAPIDDWIARHESPYPYTKSYQDACYDPIVVFHSSGSTGPPKTITQNQQFFINGHRFPELPKGKRGDFYDLYRFKEQTFITASFPFYHLAGFTFISVAPMFYPTCSIACSMPDRPATPEMVLQMLKLRPIRMLNTPPSIVEGILRLPGAEKYLKQLDSIIYAGGPLAKWAGDLLSQHTNLVSNYGSTECGPVTLLQPDPANWQWFDFHPGIHIKWDVMYDNICEMVFERDEEIDKYRPIAATILRSQPSFRTKDLFVPHPTEPGLWRFFGRNDDIIVFSNGLKWNPIPSEATISSHPLVGGTIIVGAGYLQPLAIIERKPAENPLSEAELVDELWPTIQKANRDTQRYGRLTKSRVMCVEPSIFLRTPKGSISRGATVRLLQQRIDDKDSSSANVNKSLEAPDLPITSKERLTDVVRECVHQGSLLEDFDDTMDFFAAGMDSLDAAEIALVLRSRLAWTIPAEKLDFLRSEQIFRFPTVLRLTDALYGVLFLKQSLQDGTSKPDQDLLAKYRVNIDGKGEKSTGGYSTYSVAITGTTGSLGSCLVDALIRSPNVQSVLCLNRADDAESRTKAQLSPLLGDLWSKTKFQSIDVQKADLGLSQECQDLIQQCEVVIHCAWKVNFLHSIDSFETQIQGVNTLARLALTAPRSQRLFFISSVSTVSGKSSLEAEEVVYDDIGHAAPTGYGQSKQVSERILADAAARCGLPVSILRVGQIAGYDPTFGPHLQTSSTSLPEWNRAEWFPSIVKTAQGLGRMPSEFSSIDWIPINVLSQIILEIVSHDLHPGAEAMKVYNLVNPKMSPWSTVVEPIAESLPSATTALEVEPLNSWLHALAGHNAERRDNLDRLPALKLLPFLHDRAARMGEKAAGFRVENGVAASPTMAAMKPIDAQQLRFWIRQWARSEGRRANGV